MAFNIERFRENLAQFGYLDNNSFEVLVQTPAFLASVFQSGNISSSTLNAMTTNLASRIDQVRAPGINLMSEDVSRYGLGPTQKQPVNAQFQEIYFSVLNDHNSELWRYWYNWTRGVFEYNGTPGGIAPSYTAEYKNNYSTTVQINMYDHFGKLIQVIDLYEAFPTSIREVPMAWGDPGLMKINVAMAYTEYTIQGVSTLNSQRSPVQVGYSSRLQREYVNIG